MVGLNQNRKRPWADLPPELLSIIVDLLITSNPVAVRTFRSVCNSWRSLCPRLSHPSLLSPHIPISVFNDVCCPLRTTVIYSLSRPLTLPLAEFPSLTPPSWILFLQEFQPGKVGICKPLSRELHNSYYLPPFTFPKAISSVDFKAHELGRFYNSGSQKAVLLPNGLDAVVLLDEAGRAVYSTQAELGIIRLGVGRSTFELIYDDRGLKFDDIIEFKGRVLGIDGSATVYEIGSRPPAVKEVFPGFDGGGAGRRQRNRLVESLGLLYLVVRCDLYPGATNKFKAFELDEKKGKWAEITNLGDRSFFFGLDCSFSASSRDLGLCAENCILFEMASFSRNRDYYNLFDKQISKYNCQYNCGKGYYKYSCQFGTSHLFDIGVFHLNGDIGAIKSYPRYLETLWPPPSWIWPINRMKRLEKIETSIDSILTEIPPHIKTIFECGVGTCSRLEPVPNRSLRYWKNIQNLKEALNKQKLIEQSFTLLKEHKELRDMLTELEKKESIVSGLTISPVSEEKRKCIKSSIECLRSNVDILSDEIRAKLSEKNAQLFAIAANATNLVRNTFRIQDLVFQGE